MQPEIPVLRLVETPHLLSIQRLEDTGWVVIAAKGHRISETDQRDWRLLAEAGRLAEALRRIARLHGAGAGDDARRLASQALRELSRGG